MQRILFSVVVLSLAVSGPVSAGTLPVATPSGILLDRVLPLAHLEDLDGAPDSPAVDLPRWRQAVFELSRAAESPLGWPGARELAAEATRKSVPGEVPLAVLWAAYDRMGPGRQVRPGRVFAFTALRPVIHHGADVVFTLEPADLLFHGAGELRSWAFDAGDGLGWRSLEPGRRVAVSYAGAGRKILRLRAMDRSDGPVYGAAVLQVQRLETPDPTETWSVTATESWDGSAGSGLAYLYLAPEHAVLANPVVVVEGFDLDNSMDWPVLYDLLNQENLLEDLRADGYDAVVLDFSEATEPVQRNAFVLTRLLEMVRQETGPDVTVALVGASMGGLVCRYGLAWLEDRGQDHGVRTFLSFDSPQKGANIPLGLQYWLDFFKDESEDAGYLLSRLDTPAARQMLLYHHTEPPADLPGPDPMFSSFQADLAGLAGGWPSRPRLVAVANGSGQRIDQGFAPGEQLILYEYRSWSVDIDGNVWAVPDGTQQTIFDGMINLIWPLPDTYRTVSVDSALPWDGAPGGYRASLAEMDTTAVPYGDIVALHDVHCFIPTISALALDVPDPFFDISGAADLVSLTPFDAVYYPVANQEHIAITPENKAWILAEVRAGASPVEEPDLSGRKGPVLYPAVPNPFNPITGIGFRLDEKSAVTLEVFDLAGRLVRTLVRGRIFEAGSRTLAWNGTGDGGRSLPAGTYICRLAAGDQVRTRRLTLIK